MQFFQDHEFSAGLFILLFALALPSTTSAQTFRVRTDTVGQASQFVRSDLNIAARRALSQRVGVWGYDLAGDRTGSLSSQVSFHYFNDFALTSAERVRRDTRLRSDRLALDSAYIAWRPLPMLRITGGRIALSDGFGFTDLDGGEVQFRPRLAPSVRANLQGYLGRQVVGEFETFNPDRYDLQGLPLNDDSDIIANAVTFGGRGSLSVDHNVISMAYQRRQHSENGETRVDNERVSFGAAANVWSDLNVATNVSYHTLKNDIDNALIDLAWKFGNSPFVLSTGVQHRKPVFDSSSIFNLFGDSTRQTAYGALGFRPSRTFHAKLNGWFRQYPDDQTIVETLDNDDRAVGTSVSLQTEVAAFGRPIDVSGRLSGQWSGAYGDQYIFDNALKFPLFSPDLLATHRVTVIAATADETTRHGDRLSMSIVYGLENRLSFGNVSTAAAIVSNNSEPTHLNLYVTFSTEIWP